jgi:hypothetical protein
MMDKEKLRKADIFSGGIIMLFGLWVISQALKMPMRDSWGGVQNVWFVSPALFPLFVGAVIALLGALLIRTAVKTVGMEGLKAVIGWLFSHDLFGFLKTASMMRFYAIVVLLFSFVFLNIPRVDFFLCSLLFLSVFITMFYFDDEGLLKSLLLFYLAGSALFALVIAAGAPAAVESVLPRFGDWFILAFILAYCIYAWTLIRGDLALRKKFRTSLVLAVAAPFVIGSVFKYLLLVPMPSEGIVVMLLDAVWYWDF